MKKTILLLLTISFIIHSHKTYSANTWKKIIKKNGITVFSRSVKGYSMKEFKGVITINAPIDKIWNITRNVPSLTKWMANSKSTKKVKKISPSRVIIYAILRAPFPFKDRDLLIDATYKKNRDFTYATISMKVFLKDIISLNKKFVRIKKFKATSTLVKIGDKRTRVTYTNRTDPGGIIPSWAANMVVKENPYNSLKNLRTLSEKNKNNLGYK